MYSNYLLTLQRYVNAIINILNCEEYTEEEEQNIKENLLKDANLLDKEKNQKSYKKDKHKQDKFNDGY